MASDARAREVESLLARLAHWARQRPDARGLALVGSWAYGASEERSDVDVVLLTDSPESYIRSDEWLADVGGVRLVRTRGWGAVTERRFAVRSGLEVDLCVGLPTWASVDPIDPGTRQVVSCGIRVLHDPDGVLAALLASLQQGA